MRAAADERRTIERALHDGVQQELIAVSVRLQLARQLVETDPEAAIAELDEIGRDVRGALNRVQVLANEIYPPLLDAQGLPDALRGITGVESVDAAGIGRYPQAVEAAVYFSCRDALAPAGPDARATVRLREEQDALRLEIESTKLGALVSTFPLG